MPHIIIDYSADTVTNEAIQLALDTCYEAVVNTQLFEPSHIRVRAHAIEHYRIAATASSFMHIQCRIHAGRSETQKKQLSSELVAALGQAGLELSIITCEVVDMDSSTYSKIN